MGLCFARARGTTGEEPSASITWREYVTALAAATDPAGGWSPVDLAGGPGHPPRGTSDPRRIVEPDESAARPLEIALWLVRGRTRRAVGLVDILRLQCEAAWLRLQLIQLYTRLGHADRAEALARETHAVL
jgi:hypothetical protein